MRVSLNHRERTRKQLVVLLCEYLQLCGTIPVGDKLFAENPGNTEA